MKKLNYLMDCILYQTFNIIFNRYLKNLEKRTSIRIYINKIENRTTFKTKTGYYLELLIAEIMELLGSTKSEIIINKIEETCIGFFLINLLVNCYIFHPKILYFFKK